MKGSEATAGAVARSARLIIRLRWIIAVLCGALAAIAVTVVLGLAAGLLAGWAVLALVASVWVILEVWGMDADATRAHAMVEDPGRRVARLIALIGSTTSLAAVVVVAAQAQRATGIESYALAGIAVLSVASSWLLIQVNYMLHYAKVYYQNGGSGISFNQAEPPEYTDFAYFSVGLGMTYQVADTNVTNNAIRRIVIAQTMLGYLFGAGIIATVINLITNLG
jgi:uncharacterized membrane protein